MEYTGIPIIVILCYIVGELYKYLFKNKQETYKIIPLLLTILGGILGIIIYKSEPSMIIEAGNIWIAMLIGMISGASATGANQVIKQMFLKNNND